MPIEIESPENLGYNTIECNLSESSVRDVLFKDINLDLNNLVLCYTHHTGKPELLHLIANETLGIGATDILLTAGAAGALFIIHSSLLTPNDHIIVVKPNYATNIETPKAIGCEITFIDLSFEENFALDTAKVKAALQPNTKIISITTPHNPTGTVLPIETLMELCGIAEEHNCYLLADETYRNLSFAEPSFVERQRHQCVVSIKGLWHTGYKVGVGHHKKSFTPTSFSGGERANTYLQFGGG
jgi:aspartate/methionine/tyrosine aminotransferase